MILTEENGTRFYYQNKKWYATTKNEGMREVGEIRVKKAVICELRQFIKIEDDDDISAKTKSTLDRFESNGSTLMRSCREVRGTYSK
jgi:hypothetical protein